MSEHTTNHQSDAEHPKRKKREMSRRQFLNYTLGGTGGFLIGIPLVWNLRFAIDPLLQASASGNFVKVAAENEITTTPTRFRFNIEQQDGWYYSEPEMEAWIARDENGDIYALSPICKHLGCTVNWAPEGKHRMSISVLATARRYHAKTARNLKWLRSRLTSTKSKSRDGWVYLGPVKPNTRV